MVVSCMEEDRCMLVPGRISQKARDAEEWKEMLPELDSKRAYTRSFVVKLDSKHLVVHRSCPESTE